MNRKKLKKIASELKGASKMHAGQAERIGGMLKKSPAKKSTKGLEALAKANNMKLTPMAMKKAAMKMKTAGVKMVKKSAMMMKKAGAMKMKKK